MSQKQVAIYARVSSDQQAEAGTIESQVAALRERIAQDGLTLSEELTFLDEGYSGASLIRPALEQLRDVVAMQGIDSLYVHSPDRLARKYAYQVLLVDEFRRAGVEVIFLNRELGQSPEDDLLLQVQGMVAEYERAKILERSRRGKLHAARTGHVAVLSGAPYGYRYIPKQEGGGQARYEIVLPEARVVRQVFQWVGHERATIQEVCRRLQQAGERTRSGKTTWDRTTIWSMLKNPAYKGAAAFGKTKVSAMHPKLRPQRGDPAQPKRPVSTQLVAQEEWIAVPVPALVEEALFEAVQQQLRENRHLARQRQRGARYLLQGLLICAQCGYAYYGKAVSSKAAKGKPRHYAYYRCIGTDAYRFGGQRVCENLQVRTDTLDQQVWQEVCALLEDTQRLEQEYQRRLRTPQRDREDLNLLQAQMAKVRQGIARLIDTYTEGFIEKPEFEPRIRHLRQRLADLEQKAQELTDEAARQAELRLVITRLEEFAVKVKGGLVDADWLTKRDLIRTLVQRVEIGKEEVNVVFRIPSAPFDSSPDGGFLQHCGNCKHATLGCTTVRVFVLPVLQNPGFETASDEIKQTAVMDLLAEYFQQDIVVDVVKAAFDITLDKPNCSPERTVGLLECRVASSLGSKPV
jgi:site-specific DNA recombinase